MPFNIYEVQPNNVSRISHILSNEPNELESVANQTLTNLIRQISSLGQHASSIFDKLTKDVIKINNRSQILNQRNENLKGKVSKLDDNDDEVSLDDFQAYKQFKSIKVIDQNVLSRSTIPIEIRELYEKAESPPDLFEFNSFR